MNPEEDENIKSFFENKDVSDIPHMSMESVGSIDFFKCNKCPYMALTAKDIQFHWQTSHSMNLKTNESKSITVKCPGCSGIFNSEVSLKTHLRSHHKMCARDINKLVHNLIQQFKRNKEYIENMEVIIDGYTDVRKNAPMLIELSSDTSQVVMLNNNYPMNVINLGGSATNYTINNNNASNNGGCQTKNKEQPTMCNIYKSKENIQNNSLPSIYYKNADNSELIKIPGLNPIFPSTQQPDASKEFSLERTLLKKVQSSVTLNNKTFKYQVVEKSDTKSKNTNISFNSVQTVTYYDISDNIPNNKHLNKTSHSSKPKQVIQRKTKVKHDKNKKNTLNNSKTYELHQMSKDVFKITRFKKLNRNACGIGGCSVNFLSEKILNFHRSCHINRSKKVACPKCKMTNFSTNEAFRVHLWKQHKIDLELYTCDICSYKTVNKKLLSHHVKTHFSERKYSCNVCRGTYKNSKQLATHRLIHKQHIPIRKRTKKKYCCDYCNYTCLGKDSIRLHIIRHIGIKHLKCQECKFITGDRNILNRHKETHSSIKKYKCSYCSCSYTQAHSLKTHIISKHVDKKNEALFICQKCTFTSLSKQKYETHLFTHLKDSTKQGENISKRIDSKSSPNKWENIISNSVTIVDTDIIEINQNSTSTSDNQLTVTCNSIQVSKNIEYSLESNVSTQTVSKDNISLFSDIINALPSQSNNEMFSLNNTQLRLYDTENKINDSLHPNNTCDLVYNKMDIAFDSNITSCNELFDNSNQSNFVISNIDTNDNTFFPNYGSNLIINEESTNAENASELNQCVNDNLIETVDDTSNSVTVVSTSSKFDRPSENIKINTNIFVKDILDLASSHAGISPNMYGNDLQKKVTHSPIILINPKTQTNNRIMGANLFSSNVINHTYNESSGSSQFHIPLQSSNPPIANMGLRKKPKISVKSNLILKGPDRLDHFDIRNHSNNKSSEYSLINPPYAIENYNSQIDFNVTSESIESNNINNNCSTNIISNDIYSSEQNYLSNYLLNSDFAPPNIQTAIISDKTMIQNVDLNPMPTISMESNVGDMSDIKLENKPYLTNQTETTMPNLMRNSVQNDSNIFFNTSIHVPIKFEQKMDMLSSYMNNNSAIFEDDLTSSGVDNMLPSEDVPQSFENTSGYNQSLYPFEDNYYFENDFITETLDGQEIIVLDDTWSDVKSSSSFRQNNLKNQFDQSELSVVSLNEKSVKEKPRIISEIQITNCNSTLASFSNQSGKNIALPLEFLSRNTSNDSDIPPDQHDAVFDLEEHH